MVREGGLEPPRVLARWILSPVRLPIPPLSHRPTAFLKQLATPAASQLLINRSGLMSSRNHRAKF